MANPRDPLGKLRRAIQATYDEVRNATACFEVVYATPDAPAPSEAFDATVTIAP